MKWLSLLLVTTLWLPAPRTSSAPQDSGVHGREFWLAIVADGYAVPKGMDPEALLLELNELLDSPDPVLRDEIGYGIPTQWIYRQQLFSAEQLAQQVERLSARMLRGLEDPQPQGVLGRSYAALNLSILVAQDLRQGFLGEEQFERLLAQAMAYMEKEEDLRGWDPELGWLHSCAHTSDLLKFLGRHPRLDTPVEQAALANSLAQKIIAPSGKVFVDGEDERLANALLALLARPDFPMQTFEGFRAKLLEAREMTPKGSVYWAPAEAAKRNAKNVLRVLLQFLRSGELEDIDRSEALEERVLGTLRALN